MDVKTIGILAATALCLAACGDAKDEGGAGQTKAAAVAKKAPQKKINAPVEDAMMSIPPELREDYQKAFACEVKRNKAKGDAKAINVTPEYVKDLTARLKADPSLAKC